MGYLGDNGAAIYQRDLERSHFWPSPTNLYAAPNSPKHDNNVGNTRAAALLAAANSIRYVANVPAIGFPTYDLARPRGKNPRRSRQCLHVRLLPMVCQTPQRALIIELRSVAFVATNLASFAPLAHASELTCSWTSAHVAAWRAASSWNLVLTA